MIPNYYLLVFLVLQLLVLNVTAREPKNLAKPPCQSSCGNVTIPFPFGIGSDCYLHRNFEIDCHNNKPTLSSINGSEVLGISVENQTMRINHPVFHICQDVQRSDNLTVNLSATPFFFSPEKNMFTGLGCRNIVYMWYADSDHEDGYYLGGCYSVCHKMKNYATSGDAHSSCNGINCCQTGIIPSFQVFNITIQENDFIYNGGNKAADEQQECRYAFLVEQNWFADHRHEVANMTHVPVVLDWRINEPSYSRLSIINKTSSNAFCQNSVSYNNTAYCKCHQGFEGNPYLQDGCTDINECGINPPICPSTMRCLNLIGGHNCYYPDERKSKIKTIILGIGTSLAGLFLFVVVWGLSIIIKRKKDIKRKKELFKRNGGLLLQQRLFSFNIDRVDCCKLFSSEDLDKATDHFNISRVLGQGGQGTVYKGMLVDGRIVAVKKSKVVDEWKPEEFINEVIILSQINHRNVVKLLGCCLEVEFPLLVYEFIPNGTLFQYIHNQTEELQFTWDMRLRIATEVAEALSYLHSAASIPIYHRDIKSTNILLDEMLRAKVADFGTSKSLAINQTHMTTKVQGTLGYLDPEYCQSNRFSDKSDVYSFGVVLVELLTGKSPTRSEGYGSLVSHFVVSMKENLLNDILDVQVRSGRIEEVMTIASLAERCLNLEGKKRPTMKEVAMVLERTRVSQKGSRLDGQNYEEIQGVRTEIFESWDSLSTSTSSIFVDVVRSTDDQPLMTSQ